MTEQARGNGKKMGVVGVVVVILLAVGAFAGGYLLGKRAEQGDMEKRVAALADAVQKKADYVEKLEGLASEWQADTETIDKEGIDNYVKELRGLVEEASRSAGGAADGAGGEVRAALSEYLAAWEKLQQVYDGKDNEEIMKAFSGVKSAAVEMEGKLQEALDRGVKEAVAGLGE